MHPINKILSFCGLKLSIVTKKNIPKKFLDDYNQNLGQLRKNSGGLRLFEGFFYDAGDHPVNYMDYECGFAAYNISRVSPENILDVGSYRHFILGLLAHFKVTTIDIRDRKPISDNETIVTGDSKKLNLPDNKFDIVVSLCALEHFGLGRYGDEFDLFADQKAINELIRVLKPNGRLIFTTTITNAPPSLVFNAYRIYNHEMIKNFCADLICENEKFFSHSVGEFCSLEEVTTKPNVWDVYLGCWRKK